MRNPKPWMAHVVQLALGAFMSNLGVNGHTTSWEAHQCDQQFGENESTDIGKSQRLGKEGNARIHMVLAMQPGLAKIIEKVHISRHFERYETDLHIAENACCIDYSDSWSLKWVHWLTKGKSTNSSTTYHGCENMVEFNTGVAWAREPITRIHLRVAQESKIQRLLATLHNTGWMDNRQVCNGCCKAVPITGPCVYWNGIQSLCIMSSLSTMTCSII